MRRGYIPSSGNGCLPPSDSPLGQSPGARRTFPPGIYTRSGSKITRPQRSKRCSKSMTSTGMVCFRGTRFVIILPHDVAMPCVSCWSTDQKLQKATYLHTYLHICIDIYIDTYRHTCIACITHANHKDNTCLQNPKTCTAALLP